MFSFLIRSRIIIRMLTGLAPQQCTDLTHTHIHIHICTHAQRLGYGGASRDSSLCMSLLPIPQHVSAITRNTARNVISQNGSSGHKICTKQWYIHWPWGDAGGTVNIHHYALSLTEFSTHKLLLNSMSLIIDVFMFCSELKLRALHISTHSTIESRKHLRVQGTQFGKFKHISATTSCKVSCHPKRSNWPSISMTLSLMPRGNAFFLKMYFPWVT